MMMKILVIDDEAGMGRIFERLLRERGEVTATTDGAEALELLEKETFDLILCDLNMPAMSGIEFYQGLEQLGGDTARLVFVTGGAFTAEDQEFIDTVENRVLSKPFGIKELFSLVDEVLQQ